MLVVGLALACALSPQLQHAEFPRPDADPVGRVVDPDGKPIPGARVTLRVDLERMLPWALSVQQVLKAHPFPSTVSGQDGYFQLQLAPAHRALGSAGEGFYTLVAEKDGWQGWHERLTRGPAGCVGSRVVLRPLLPEDRVRVEVAAPELGMRVWLARVDDDDPDPGLVLDVPQGGAVEAAFPLLPNPLPPTSGAFWTPVGRRARLLWKEGIGEWVAVAPGLRLARPNATASRPTSGLAVLGPTRLGRTPWPFVPVPPPPQTPLDLRVRVVDPNGAPVRGALVRLSDTALGARPYGAWRLEAVPGPIFAGPPHWTDAAGQTLVRGLPDPTGAHSRFKVLVVADGFLPMVGAAVEASLLDEKTRSLTVRLEHGRCVELVARTARGRASAFLPLGTWPSLEPVDMRFANPLLLLEKMHGCPVATDSLGRLRLRVPDLGLFKVLAPGVLDTVEIPLGDTPVVLGAEESRELWLQLPEGVKLGATVLFNPAGPSHSGGGAHARTVETSQFLMRMPESPGASFWFSPNGTGLAPFALRLSEARPVPRFPELALFDRGTVLDRARVTVCDAQGRPLAGAIVEAAPAATEREFGDTIPDWVPGRTLLGPVVRALDGEAFPIFVRCPGYVNRRVLVPKLEPGAGPVLLEVRLEEKR